MNDSSTEPTRQARTFFEQYATALLARDEHAIAALYAVPSLILFPGQSIAVHDAQQTAAFFAAGWGQYEGVEEADFTLTIMGATAASIWADVVWTYAGVARERFCYQLIPAESGHQIAVLTPMPLDVGFVGPELG